MSGRRSIYLFIVTDVYPEGLPARRTLSNVLSSITTSSVLPHQEIETSYIKDVQMLRIRFQWEVVCSSIIIYYKSVYFIAMNEPRKYISDDVSLKILVVVIKCTFVTGWRFLCFKCLQEELTSTPSKPYRLNGSCLEIILKFLFIINDLCSVTLNIFI